MRILASIPGLTVTSVRRVRRDFDATERYECAQYNGCELRPGDLLGTGTLSGPTAGEEGALLESTEGGKKPILLPDGETRTFLEDDDAVAIRGWCEHEGYVRIGLGQVVGRVASHAR